jgi:hypothetical protein
MRMRSDGGKGPKARQARSIHVGIADASVKYYLQATVMLVQLASYNAMCSAAFTKIGTVSYRRLLPDQKCLLHPSADVRMQMSLAAVIADTLLTRLCCGFKQLCS